MHAHGLVATCHAISLCVLLVWVLQLRFCVRTRSGVDSLYLAKQWCSAVVQEAMAATKSGPSEKSSCGRRASHGLPHLSYSLSTRFSQRLCLAQLSQPWYLCASVPLILCLYDSLVEEFTPFGFPFSIFQLTASDHKANLLIKPFVPSFLKISMPL